MHALVELRPICVIAKHIDLHGLARCDTFRSDNVDDPMYVLQQEYQALKQVLAEDIEEARQKR